MILGSFFRNLDYNAVCKGFYRKFFINNKLQNPKNGVFKTVENLFCRIVINSFLG